MASLQRGQTSTSPVRSNAGTQRQHLGQRTYPRSWQCLTAIPTESASEAAAGVAASRSTWETMKSSGRKVACFSTAFLTGSPPGTWWVTVASRALPSLPAARWGSIASFTRERIRSRSAISASKAGLVHSEGAWGQSCRWTESLMYSALALA